ncbi:MAG: hypothetical protein E6Q60_05290 [Nitrosomonas oligotropha]|uniref:Uncharacterized protein n=1 Tax=Nitrosomonas oligotropha TaxID=42354 RepID=A0A5C7VTM4_9PROT|nr:MAG: hypothetical protein E6Q60_05290 [Nitrosomonas oligotropha]
MATISFLVNGKTAQQTKPTAWVTIEEMASGSLLFKVKQGGGTMENLHGVYFDITDESILNTLRVTAVSNAIRADEESVNCLKNGTDASESCVDTKAQDGMSSYSFTLHSTARALTLCDFPQIQLDYSGDGGSSNMNTNDDFSHRWLYLGLF